ncbi:YebC/PmpR family DNA-binding transcriptional regulator [uncultured Cytophaga sp.]|uniref:YebC/PmpR family DNA-binding transcriptional regulator n=1 Tax=uncultured Cytophaga sp. TaxID=160238 RepID=UPI002626B76D|nr:YebC/PmpR family DNA-binding transcriptional regulator [uncultured Cytophaga sp.]
MGRAYELRKGRRAKRFDRMAKAFTRLGKEIVMAAKQGGANIDTNARLRTAVNNAKGLNMPKDRIDAAIKRASGKDESDYEEVVFEGYGPYGIAILVECATDNNTRTVANVRSYFTRSGGALGKTGSLEFLFERKGVIKIDGTGLDPEELELELIDFGAEEIVKDENEIFIYTAFVDFGAMQKELENRGMTVINAETERIPNTTTTLTAEQQEELYKLLEKFEDDDDVQAVFHNMAETE